MVGSTPSRGSHRLINGMLCTPAGNRWAMEKRTVVCQQVTIYICMYIHDVLYFL